MVNWTLICEGEQGTLAYRDALAVCKGVYQSNLIRGRENLSGSTLKGKAATWGRKYAASRQGLLSRLTKNSIPHHEEIGDHGKRLLVLGTW